MALQQCWQQWLALLYMEIQPSTGLPALVS